MNYKKIRFFLRLHWIKLLVGLAISTLAISLTIFIPRSITAWRESESYTKQYLLASSSIQLYGWLIMGLLQAVVYTYMWYWMMFRRGGYGQFATPKKKAISGEEVGITWNDVIGMEEAKQEALEVVKLIKDRAELQRIGGKILRGLLLVGPPGCGKTYLAKAMATEAKLPFISMSGSEFVEMFVGVGASRIRKLFRQARELAMVEGGCIIFIDEIDAVGAQRAADMGFGGQTERNTTVNQLLVEMDGLKEKEYNVVIIAATNMPENYLDPALLRPGRFDRKIYVDLPNLEDREKLFDYYLKKVKFDPASLKTDRLAMVTVGLSPADIANIVREAALIAVRYEKPLISMKEIDEARERIALGIKRHIRLSEQEKKLTAFHEAGHLLVTYFLVLTKDVFKATIIPRKSSGGATWTPEKEETLIRDKNALLGEIKACLGGFVAENLKFGYTSAGVDSDFEVAMAIAHNMAWRWGMGKSGLIGNFHTLASRQTYNQSLVSEETKVILDRDSQEILNNCRMEVYELLNKEIVLLDRFANELISKEELDYDQIESIFKEYNKSRSQNFPTQK